MDQARSLYRCASRWDAVNSYGSMGRVHVKSEFTLGRSVFQSDPSQYPSCGGKTPRAAASRPGAAERGRRKMRKSLLTVIVVGALASGAAPGLTAENTQQRVEHYAAMPNGMSGAY